MYDKKTDANNDNRNMFVSWFVSVCVVFVCVMLSEVDNTLSTVEIKVNEIESSCQFISDVNEERNAYIITIKQ